MPNESGLDPHSFIKGFHGVRYQVKDVARSVEFYTRHLGFKLEHQQLPAFANVSLGGVSLLLSGPGASGSRPMPGGQNQEPGGWNRVVLRVADLPGCITVLKSAGIVFATSWRPVPADGKFRLKIRTATRSSCSSPRDSIQPFQNSYNRAGLSTSIIFRVATSGTHTGSIFIARPSSIC